MENIYKDLHSNQKILIYEMLKRGISVDVLDSDREIIRASYRGHEELIYDRDSSIMPYSVSVIAGDKGLTKRILAEHGISVPLGEVFCLKNCDFIHKAFKVIDMPVVIKPVFGSHGYDVHINLQSEEEIDDALDKIARNRGSDTDVLIEEYYPGNEYRVFVTKDRDYAVLYREPAHVIGDGTSTIRELIDCENYRRMHPRKNALCEIYVDQSLYDYMDRVGLSMDDVPGRSEKVYLRPNSNVAMGGLCIDYTDKVHPSVIDIGMDVLKAFPGMPYVGIDFMTNTISDQQTRDSYRIIEINTVPGIHMHFQPAIGKSQNVAKYMVDLIYPETKEKPKQKNLKL